MRTTANVSCAKFLLINVEIAEKTGFWIELSINREDKTLLFQDLYDMLDLLGQKI